MVDHNGTALQDVPIRSWSALAAYFPLAKKVFGAIRIQRAVRLRLFSSLVVSRLIDNIYTWSKITGAMYSKLNSVYMRGLRRIAARSRFSVESARAAGSDQLVREELGVPSLHFLIVQKRLMLLASVMKHAPPHVTAMLAPCTEDPDRQRLPWVRLVLDDLNRLKNFQAQKLAELGLPSGSPAEWAKFMQGYPSQWKQLVKTLHYFACEYDLQKASALTTQNATPAWRHRCFQCSRAFRTEQCLKQHDRTKHGKRTCMTAFIGASLVCPVCFVKLHSSLGACHGLEKPWLAGGNVP